MNPSTHRSNPGDWTSEQANNAMKYGVCWECGTPREVRQQDRHVSLICPRCDEESK